jgi:hypothetical protein
MVFGDFGQEPRSGPEFAACSSVITELLTTPESCL